MEHGPIAHLGLPFKICRIEFSPPNMSKVNDFHRHLISLYLAKVKILKNYICVHAKSKFL